MPDVTPAESKNIEGQRLTALFGAIGALPGAALVASGPQGAPLFILAICAVAAAYMFWMFTDDTFEASITIRPEDSEWRRLSWLGYFYQWSTFGYGALSIALTLTGFAGVHSNLRSGISVEAGFVFSFIAALAMVGHVGISMHLRNALTPLVIAVAARKQAAAVAAQEHAEDSNRTPAG